MPYASQASPSIVLVMYSKGPVGAELWQTCAVLWHSISHHTHPAPPPLVHFTRRDEDSAFHGERSAGEDQSQHIQLVCPIAPSARKRSS
jgi:hypothetical protein